VSRVRAHVAWVVVLVALVAAWQAWVRLRGVPQYVLPAPTDVARTLWDERGPLASAAGVTAREMLAGFGLALAFGLAAAIALHASPTVRRAVYPLLVASQSVPVVAIAPILVIYLGFGLAPKLVIVALVCFFPVTINVYDGLRDSDPDARKLLRSLDATRWQRLRFLEAPSALPSAFTGAKIAAAVAVIGAVFGEFSGSDKGLGHLLVTANAGLATARLFAATLLLFVEAIALYAVFAALERRVVDWR